MTTGQSFDADAFSIGEGVEEMVDQQRDVVAPLSERRHDNMNHIDAIEEIFAELAVGNEAPPGCDSWRR